MLKRLYCKCLNKLVLNAVVKMQQVFIFIYIFYFFKPIFTVFCQIGTVVEVMMQVLFYFIFYSPVYAQRKINVTIQSRKRFLHYIDFNCLIRGCKC